MPTLYGSIGLTPCLWISTMHQDPAPLPDNMPFPYDTNAYPGRRSSSAPFSPASHILSHKACGGEHRDTGSTSSRSTHQEARRGQCDTLVKDTKNGWRNGKGYVAFSKSSASSPSVLIHRPRGRQIRLRPPSRMWPRPRPHHPTGTRTQTCPYPRHAH